MVIEDQLLLATVCPSQHAEHNELRNHIPYSTLREALPCFFTREHGTT